MGVREKLEGKGFGEDRRDEGGELTAGGDPGEGWRGGFDTGDRDVEG